MDLEKVAERISEKLGTHEKKSYSDKSYGDGSGRHMRWGRPREFLKDFP